MPINIPNELPATAALLSEQVFVMSQERACHQDIRPLELLFLNLMPKKINTEIQYMRRLSNTPLQVNITLLRIDNHLSNNTPQEHLDTFYKNFDEVKDKRFDGMIITGAPLDQKRFSEVKYWNKLKDIIIWSDTHVSSTLFSCWAVAAAFKVFYDLDISFMNEKLSGIYKVTCSNHQDELACGFDDHFVAPLSRYCDFNLDEIRKFTDINVIASSSSVGLYLGASKNKRQVYVTGHPEYDANTLADEYFRDVSAGKHPEIPVNYFPENNPSNKPCCTWRSHSALLFANWLNYYVYQLTPYDLYA